MMDHAQMMPSALEKMIHFAQCKNVYYRAVVNKEEEELQVQFGKQLQ